MKTQPLEFATVARIASGRWDAILPSLGIRADCMTGKHTACPGCTGKDRFRYAGGPKGKWFCGQGGETTGGDGFDLLCHVFGMPKGEALRAVADFLGVTQYASIDDGARAIKRRHMAQQAEGEMLLLKDLTIVMGAVTARVAGRELIGDEAFMQINPQYRQPPNECMKQEVDAAKNVVALLSRLHRLAN